ncbi:hypothetical protein FSP39_025202 [Pinctada imbricata]|uniref:G8 domain-containing protein n=1 Tax=Pinctada imbricata TaxID=66713 RepID=A0AA88XLX2_PINIB|nr:hypothetical protein FSP39_025202 [Pinctada imbricata]
MHIGSEDCKFSAKASITLLGEPGELEITGFGEKFIGVQSGGTLELHGQDKLSWTKVTKTVLKFDLSLGQKFGHKELEGTQHWDGVFAYQFTPDGTYVNRLFRSISHNRQKSVDWNIGKLKKFMDGVADGNILAFATQRDHNRKGSDHSALYDLIDSVAGPNKLRQIGSKSAYALVTVKGQPSSTVDSLSHVDLNSNSDSAYARVERAMTVNGEDLQLVVESYYNARRRWMGYSNFRVMDTKYSNPIIDLVDEPRGWKAGDRIFVTSTDYDWQQVEERTLMSCPTCTATQIKVDKPFEYEHFGEIVKNVDMRAEVGLMTRNILIRGEVSKDQTNGGHVKFLKGFKSVRVEGVELTKMGQPMKLGRYPLHYHMCDNLTDSTMYPTPSYIRKNSIHHTQFRCLTIHGTHGAHVTENVCYDTFGHGFFIEDGGEKETYYYRNLGLGQRRWRGRIKVPETGTIPTDKTATTFWLTNPKTTLIGNVAAGGDGAGMWFVYPDIPTGPSSTMNLMAEREARRTKITKFENNVCHSYNKAGLFVDNIEQDDLTVKGYNQYNPRENPLDRKSPSVPVLFNRLTGMC